MTPFMQKVDEILSGAIAPALGSAPSIVRPIGEALHSQVELRALAEQLVSEGNVVIADPAHAVQLIDHPGGEHLAFTVVCGHARADLVTDVSGRQARARLILDGSPTHQREVDGSEGLTSLLLLLIAQGHPASSER